MRTIKRRCAKLIRYQPAPLSKEEDAKLFSLFSYYAWGMNIVDMAKLRWDKETLPNYIEYFRTKTRYTKSFRIPIIEPLWEILNYCRNYSPKGYVFMLPGTLLPRSLRARAPLQL